MSWEHFTVGDTIVRFEFERDGFTTPVQIFQETETKLIVATSPKNKGLQVHGNTLDEIATRVPEALQSLREAAMDELIAMSAEELFPFSKSEASREATPAVETVSAQRGVAAFESGCHALIDDVGGQ